MPFDDEPQVAIVIPYRKEWAAEFVAIRRELMSVIGAEYVIDHIGSTSVPELAAKDCIDIQVRTHLMPDQGLASQLANVGWRLRPETWNSQERSFGIECSKMVFAPPIGYRRANLHVRVAGQENCRFALLFRDYLRSMPQVRDEWSTFKQQLSTQVPRLDYYGQIKAPATNVLMRAASAWANEVGWALPKS